MKKTRFTFSAILLSIIIICTIGNITSSRPFTEKSIKNFSLEIYYVSPYLNTDMPLTVEYMLKNVSPITISGSDLKKHVNLFNKLQTEKFTYCDTPTYLNARIYYILKNQFGKKILDVAMWSSHEHVFFNGIEVSENTIFYEAILPFLPQENADELIRYINTRGRFSHLDLGNTRGRFYCVDSFDNI